MQSVIAVTQEETSEEGMCLDIDGRQAEEGKTVRLTEGNSIGWMLRRETDDGWTVDRRNGGSVDGMVEHAVDVLTKSEDGKGRAGQPHEPADSDMMGHLFRVARCI